MNITIVGTGHVGLVVGLCFAEIGHQVVCVDNDNTKIDALKAGRIPFFEPHMQDLLARALQQNTIVFASSLDEVIDHAEVIFLCLGTPPLPDGEADLSSVERVTRQIATATDAYRLIVEKSTVPVLTGERIEKTMSIYRRQRDKGFDVASNPEFLAEGSAVMDFLCPDRVVIGVESSRARELLEEVYAPIVNQSFPWQIQAERRAAGRTVRMLVTNRNSAELIKHASNCFLAMKISYINAVANLCDQVNADVGRVAEGMGLDHRIGPHFLSAGIGFGGFCFPKDLQAFIRIAENRGCDFRLLREVERVNLDRVKIFLQKLKSEVWVLRDKTIAAWGLSFKANTDDLRFSPALEVVDVLATEEKARVQVYDPQASDEARRERPDLERDYGVRFCASPLEAASGADALLILTDWPEFRSVDLAALRGVMTRAFILDGRNWLDPEKVRAAGFEYVSMGRP
jgi:UDPglucose 6-dehydrogenase